MLFTDRFRSESEVQPLKASSPITKFEKTGETPFDLISVSFEQFINELEPIRSSSEGRRMVFNPVHSKNA